MDLSLIVFVCTIVICVIVYYVVIDKVKRAESQYKAGMDAIKDAESVLEQIQPVYTTLPNLNLNSPEGIRALNNVYKSQYFQFLIMQIRETILSTVVNTRGGIDEQKAVWLLRGLEEVNLALRENAKKAEAIQNEEV